MLHFALPCLMKPDIFLLKPPFIVDFPLPCLITFNIKQEYPCQVSIFFGLFTPRQRIALLNLCCNGPWKMLAQLLANQKEKYKNPRSCGSLSFYMYPLVAYVYMCVHKCTSINIMYTYVISQMTRPRSRGIL